MQIFRYNSQRYLHFYGKIQYFKDHFAVLSPAGTNFTNTLR